jgi:hypothetical protein
MATPNARCAIWISRLRHIAKSRHRDIARTSGISSGMQRPHRAFLDAPAVHDEGHDTRRYVARLRSVIQLTVRTLPRCLSRTGVQ